MPTYKYICKNCHKQFEIQQKITEDALQECPECHQPTLQRGPGGGIGLQFKGTGFYLTDYAKPKSCDDKSSSSDGGCCPCKKD